MTKSLDPKQALTVAEVVGLAVIIRNERHCVFLHDMFRVLFNKLCGCMDQSPSTHKGT